MDIVGVIVLTSAVLVSKKAAAELAATKWNGDCKMRCGANLAVAGMDYFSWFPASCCKSRKPGALIEIRGLGYVTSDKNDGVVVSLENWISLLSREQTTCPAMNTIN